ncbi:energy-coupling factor transport system ATP-binding protein [Mumia flava]|uniref:Energy-coupling factor transport system ATP-binding protein n=1 Tax=Mumia flava TaxID=1348852 RepID=A0A2M9BEY6_9ACTN|nr:ABC transporter ATP-binding protein [Mumia flava]PJJ56510.1 energy-coupling factor transport system ATP-binding protein [Mumia flava]
MTDPVIEVDGFRFRYPGADEDTLRGVDLTIEAGDFVAVVGGNGSGKTTLCKTFNGLVPHFWSGDVDGSVRVAGHDVAGSSVAALSRLVGYVYQDFGNQLVRPTVRDDVAFGPVNYGLADHAERTAAALETLGIAAIADRFVWELSGGQQHLTALAGVLAMRPEVIVVDEPVAELDPARAEETYRMLARINERGTTVVVIEHHAELVARYARSVVLMADGRVRWHRGVREALASTADLAAHGIPAPQVVQATARLVPHAPVPLSVDEAATALRSAGVGAAGAPPIAGSAAADAGPPSSGAPVATLRGVTHGYRDVHGRTSRVLDDVDLSLHEGERIAVVGSNGAGKSTLLRLLTGLMVPRAGTVTVDGADTRATRPVDLADRVCYLYQRPEQMFLKDCIRDDVAMFPTGRGRPDAAAIVDDVLVRLRLAELADRDGRTLSGGQQRRATLGIGLATTPRLLLLDEPTASLDVGTREDVTAMLQMLAEHIRCVVVATHDMHLVAEWADRVIVLHQARVLADLTPSELFDTPDLLETVNLVPPQITELGRAMGIHPPPLGVDAFVGAFEHAGASVLATIGEG